MEALCSLCKSTVTAETQKLCKKCSEMEQQIDYLISNHTQTVREYLYKKFNETADEETRKGDRRVKAYKPPRGTGTHTPDRRKRIRRVTQISDCPKRRKIDI